MGCRNLLSGPNSNHRLETTVHRPMQHAQQIGDDGKSSPLDSHFLWPESTLSPVADKHAVQNIGLPQLSLLVQWN